MKFFICVISFISILRVSESWSYQEATVKNDYVVIYQDSKLTIPLVKVKQGKKLYVGSKSLNQGTTLSVVINNSIAYVKSSALNFKDMGKHNQSIEKDYSENKFQNHIKYKSVEERMATQLSTLMAMHGLIFHTI